jgi:hypothetical protein
MMGLQRKLRGGGGILWKTWLLLPGHSCPVPSIHPNAEILCRAWRTGLRISLRQGLARNIG